MDTEKYYIGTSQNVQEGPFSLELVLDRYNSPESQENVLIWTKGWTNWVPLKLFLAEYQTGDISRLANYMPFVFPGYSFGGAIKKCFKHYFDFKGRATRSEYWYFQLFVYIFSFIFGMAGGLLSVYGSMDDIRLVHFIGLFFGLIFFFPVLGVTIRRLHDIGLSGWWLLPVYIVSFFIFIKQIDYPNIAWDGTLVALYIASCIMETALIIICCKDSKRGFNKYGVSEKYPD